MPHKKKNKTALKAETIRSESLPLANWEYVETLSEVKLKSSGSELDKLDRKAAWGNPLREFMEYVESGYVPRDDLIVLLAESLKTYLFLGHAGITLDQTLVGNYRSFAGMKDNWIFLEFHYFLEAHWCQIHYHHHDN